MNSLLATLVWMRRLRRRGLGAVALVACAGGSGALAAPAATPRTGGPAPAASAAAPGASIPMAELTRACTHCHGTQGRASPSGYLPRLAGKPQAYLYAQLLHFRDGRRSQPAMAHLLAPLSDDYLLDMASYFAGLALPYPPPEPSRASTTELARGQRLVRQGDAQAGLPACTACHGERLTGLAPAGPRSATGPTPALTPAATPAVPGLLGLPRDYLVAQLGAWRTGHRQAQAPDCMARIAARLQPADVAAVVSWLSAQAVPSDSGPALQAPPPPAHCGLSPSEAGR